MTLSRIHDLILGILKSRPEGVEIQEIRKALGLLPGQHEHLNKRLRELYPQHVIDRQRAGRLTIYTYRGPRPPGQWDYSEVSKKLRAQVLFEAQGCCMMCGRTIRKDGITLHVDHKIPREWGGASELGNLQALCSACNEGKRNFFAHLDPGVMQEVLRQPSVHARIGELLKQYQGTPVDSGLISLVASAIEYQEDWQKRLRELRLFGWKIRVKRKKEGRRTKTSYILDSFMPLPADPGKWIRAHERRQKDDRGP